MRASHLHARLLEGHAALSLATGGSTGRHARRVVHVKAPPSCPDARPKRVKQIDTIRRAYADHVYISLSSGYLASPGFERTASQGGDENDDVLLSG